VVLVNSLGTTLALWQRQLPALTARFRVLRYDQRGHGGSSVSPGPYTVELLAGDLRQLLDRLGIERASLCGLSLGGAVAMLLAAQQPERVERLVLSCTSARFAAPEQWRRRAELARTAGMGAVAEAAIPRWFTPRFAAEHPALAAGFRRMLLATPAEGYAASCEAIADFDFRAELHRIGSPTLVLAGSEDRVATASDAELLSSRISDARLAVLEGASHLANVERPDAFDAALLEHLGAASGSERA
jgi:3-oxoadipate enol-lactonase